MRTSGGEGVETKTKTWGWQWWGVKGQHVGHIMTKHWSALKHPAEFLPVYSLKLLSIWWIKSYVHQIIPITPEASYSTSQIPIVKRDVALNVWGGLCSKIEIRVRLTQWLQCSLGLDKKYSRGFEFSPFAALSWGQYLMFQLNITDTEVNYSLKHVLALKLWLQTPWTGHSPSDRCS